MSNFIFLPAIKKTG